MHERKLLVNCVQNDHKKKAQRSDLNKQYEALYEALEAKYEAKYEALEEFDKNRSNKEATTQFNVPRSTLSTSNQPISTLFC